MNNGFSMHRRQALKIGGGAVLGGLAMMAQTRLGWAQTQLPVAKVLNSGGSLNQTLQQLVIDMGYLEEFGVQPDSTNVQDTSSIIAGIVSNQYDVCMFSGINSLFPAMESGAELRILAGSTMRLQQAIYTGNLDLQSLKDLEGRNVGVGPMGALLHSAVVAAMDKVGADASKVTFINIGSSSNIIKAVAAKTVDAGVSTTDFLDQQEALGVHILSDGKLWETLNDYTFQGAFASVRAIEENRDALVRMLAVYGKAYRFISDPASKDPYVKAAVTALGADAAVGAASQWDFMNENKTLASDLVLSEDRLTNLQALNVKLGTQQTVLPYAQVADMSLAEDALKLLA